MDNNNNNNNNISRMNLKKNWSMIHRLLFKHVKELNYYVMISNSELKSIILIKHDDEIASNTYPIIKLFYSNINDAIFIINSKFSTQLCLAVYGISVLISLGKHAIVIKIVAGNLK